MSRAGRARIGLAGDRHDDRGGLVRPHEEGSKPDSEVRVMPDDCRGRRAILGHLDLNCREPVHPGYEQSIALDQFIEATKNSCLQRRSRREAI